MIFVALGTQDKSFKRLLEMIQKEIDNGTLKDKIIVQSGYTKFDSSDMEIFAYISREEFEKYITECDLIITHGGVGNILAGMKANKKIIAVARLVRYGEHANDHQLQIIEKFSTAGYILSCQDNLGDVLNKVKDFEPKKWNFDNRQILEKIAEHIDGV